LFITCDEASPVSVIKHESKSVINSTGRTPELPFYDQSGL